MKVLAISVHPDDETLGCGGTILKHRSNGDEVYWLILTSAKEDIGYSKEFISQRDSEIKAVSQAYDFKKTYELGLPAGHLHSVDFFELIDKTSHAIKEIKPDIIYTVNRSDIHSDHQIAAQAIFSATKSFRNTFIKRILAYECLSETEIAPPLLDNTFLPNVFSDISQFLDHKIDIMKIYESELQDPPFPRSIKNIKALARFRGSTISRDYAEAFMVLRDIF